MEQKDYYQILGVDPTADPKQIKEAYRHLAFQFHPDRNKENPGAAEKMKQINEAYAVLSHPEKRREYDLLRHRFGPNAYHRFRQNYSENDIFRGSDIHHVFEEMTRTFGFRNFDEIFKDFYGQGYRSFEFKRPGFFAKGFVFSGPFSKRLRDQTPASLPGGLGKLSRFFLKKIAGLELPQTGSDIHDSIYLSPEHAVQGGPYAYFLKKRSKKLIAKIPPGVAEGQQIRLAGMGEDGKGGAAPGDLYLKVHIRKPLLRKIKELFT